MNKSPETSKRRAGHTTQSKPVRILGYAIAIIVQIVILYILRHLKEWGVNFLNEDYENALFYVELSIYVSIAIHFIFILYDNRWFKNLLQGVSNIFGALAIIMVYVIFPFIIENESWVKVIRIALLVLFVLSIIGALAEIIKGFRNLARDPGRI
jgi:hypothetical protein